MKHALTVLGSTALLSACAVTPGQMASQPLPAPIVQQNQPAATLPPAASQPEPAAPVSSQPVVIPPVVAVPPVAPPKPAAANPKALVDKLLPDYVKPRQGWRDDLVSAFSSLQLPHSAENYCAVIPVR